MIQVFSTQKCKEIDKKTIDDIGIPSIVLMENAARSIAEKLKSRKESFLIICGNGNNGGDGLALARQLIMRKKLVKVYVVSQSDNYTNDFKTNFDILKNLNLHINIIKSYEDINETFTNDLKEFDNTVDCIFGVGLNKDVHGIYERVVEYINNYSNNVISVDVPSGLDGDSGNIKNVCVKANETYTLETIKKGFLVNKAIDYLGNLNVLKIGIPDSIKSECSEEFYILEKEDYKKLIPERKVYGHKGNYGRALIFAGSIGYTGAAYIVTECTVRSGAGLTTLICKDKEIQNTLSQKLIEAMTINFEENNIDKNLGSANSIAFGPGIGTEKREENLLKLIIEKSKCPIIIDADGITILAKNKHLFSLLKGRCVITPHPGEMARLTGMSIEEVEADRTAIAKKIANEYGVIVLLKGYNTIITDGNRVFANPTGNSSMASGGMGDALTGIINGFVSQGIDIMNATLFSAYLHGYIADELRKDKYIINARDVIRELPEKINKILY